MESLLPLGLGLVPLQQSFCFTANPPERTSRIFSRQPALVYVRPMMDRVLRLSLAFLPQPSTLLYLIFLLISSYLESIGKVRRNVQNSIDLHKLWESELLDQ